MRKNGYLEKIKVRDKVIHDATMQTYIQFVVDMLVVTLNNPEVMGKDTFGAGRIKKVVEGMEAAYGEYHEAMTKSVEADYVREKLDKALIKALGEKDFEPFEKRYEFLPEIKYDRSVR